MSPWEILAVLGAGLVAGAINTVVGSGSLVTFPTLLAFGVPALSANVSNAIGLVPGTASGVAAYRRELAGQGRRIALLGTVSVCGGAGGAFLLLQLPSTVFRRAVPVLILLACLLVVVQPTVARWLEARGPRPQHGGPGLLAGVLATSVYGGYFGAAQGVILIALLGMFLDDDLQRLNGTKNLLTLLATGAAAVVFIVWSNAMSWEAVGCIAVGSVVGGQLGGTVGRRLSPGLLRAVILVVGVTAAVVLLV